MDEAFNCAPFGAAAGASLSSNDLWAVVCPPVVGLGAPDKPSAAASCVSRPCEADTVTIEAGPVPSGSPSLPSSINLLALHSGVQA